MVPTEVEDAFDEAMASLAVLEVVMLVEAASNSVQPRRLLVPLRLKQN